MRSKPKVSIVTVCFNCKEDLEKTMKSVSSQTCRNYEYIIIDGGSKDGSVEMVHRYKREVDYFVTEKDSGVYNAMNKGAKVAMGEYLYFLNAGDTFFDSKTLEKVEEKLGNVDMLYGNIAIVSKDVKEVSLRKKVLNMQSIKLGKKVSQQVVFIKKDLFNKVKGLNEKYKIAADFDLLCKVFESTKDIKYVDTTICNYDNGGISSNLKKSYNDTAEVIKVRYGVVYFFIYQIIKLAKLFVSNFIK